MKQRLPENTSALNYDYLLLLNGLSFVFAHSSLTVINVKGNFERIPKEKTWWFALFGSKVWSGSSIHECLLIDSSTFAVSLKEKQTGLLSSKLLILCEDGISSTKPILLMDGEMDKNSQTNMLYLPPPGKGDSATI